MSYLVKICFRNPGLLFNRLIGKSLNISLALNTQPSNRLLSSLSLVLLADLLPQPYFNTALSGLSCTQFLLYLRF